MSCVYFVAVSPPPSTFLFIYMVFAACCLSSRDRNTQQESFLFVGNLTGHELSYSP